MFGAASVLSLTRSLGFASVAMALASDEPQMIDESLETSSCHLGFEAEGIPVPTLGGWYSHEGDGPQQFVCSMPMCWIGLDRGIRLVEKRSFPAPVKSWRRVRDRVYRSAMNCGWRRMRQIFVQRYDDDVLDATDVINLALISAAFNLNRSPGVAGEKGVARGQGFHLQCCGVTHRE
jgi:hypothetical protein